MILAVVFVWTISGLILATVFVWTLSSWFSYICWTEIWEYRLICIWTDIGCSICVNPEFLIDLTWIDTVLKAVLVVGHLLQTNLSIIYTVLFKTRWIMKMRDFNYMYTVYIRTCWIMNMRDFDYMYTVYFGTCWIMNMRDFNYMYTVYFWTCWIMNMRDFNYMYTVYIRTCWIIKMRDFNYMTWNLYNLSWFPVDTGGI